MSLWTWEDSAFDKLTDDQVDAFIERNEPIVEALAAQIANLRHEEEQMRFAFSSEDDDYRPSVYEVELEDSGDEEKARVAQALYDSRQRLEKAAQDARMGSLLTQLSELGARMCRLYEHWNEDEQYMEYMERDRE